MAATPRKIARLQAREAAKTASVTVTLGEVIDGMAALSALASLPMEAKTSYRISRVVRAVNEEMKLFQEQRIALLDKFGTKGETEWQFETPEARADFDREFNDLLKVEIELQVAQIRIAELNGLKMTPADLAALDWLVTE